MKKVFWNQKIFRERWEERVLPESDEGWPVALQFLKIQADVRY